MALGRREPAMASVMPKLTFAEIEGLGGNKVNGRSFRTALIVY